MFNKKSKAIIIAIMGSLYNLTIVGVSVFLMKLINSIIEFNYERFKIASLQLIVIYIVQVISYGIYSNIKYNYINKQMTEIKSNVCYNIMGKSIIDFHEKSIDEYISFIFKDIDLLKEKYYKSIINIMENIILFILATSAIIYIYPYYLIVVIVVAMLSMLFPILFATRGKSLIERLSKLNKINMEWIRNSLEGYKIINTFKINNKISVETHDRLKKYQLVESQMDILLSHLEIGLQLMLSLVTVITFVIGGLVVSKGSLTIGALIALVQLVLNAANPLIIITTSIGNIKATEGIRHKYKELLLQKRTGGFLRPNFSCKYPLEFKNVTFSYIEGGKNILENFSFQFKKGKKYCIMGSNGSGKSTLLKLTFGMFNNYKGEILLYGIDIKSLTDRNILDIISYLEQEVFIFNKNIQDNILMERKGDEAKKALEIMDYIGLSQRLENKNDMIMHNSLSGGEIKKIGISRILSRESPILIVDEGDADLDNDALNLYYKTLKEENRDLILAISHRLSDDDIFDEIINLDSRKVDH